MTRLEELKEDIKNNRIWVKGLKLKDYLNVCPRDVYCGDDDCDIDSAIYKDINCNEIVGCRGISCETCWNKEMK